MKVNDVVDHFITQTLVKNCSLTPQFADKPHGSAAIFLMVSTLQQTEIMAIIPTKFFLTKGVGVHEKEARAFEECARDAHIHACNLVKASSIIPPGCKLVSRQEGLRYIQPGQITFAVFAESLTIEPGQRIVVGIGIAQPKDKTRYGYITEIEAGIGLTDENVEQDVIEMALENIGTESNPKFNGEKAYRKGKKSYRLEGRDISVDSIVQSAEGAEQNQYTAVMVAAVFIYE